MRYKFPVALPMQACYAAIFMLLACVCQPQAMAQAGQWAWVQGNQGTNNAVPTYGTKGVASAQNQPALRYGSGTWKDASGNLWLIGGYGEDSVSAQGYLNDVWTYNIAASTWTWVNGSNVVGPNYGQGGVYGTLGVANSTNVPGGRFVPAIWQDSSGNVWMFGGAGQDSTGTVNGNGSLNDLWLYSPATNVWTWMGGSTTTPRFGAGQPGVYGTLGTAASGNLPGGRYGAATWTDASGNFWLFGGSGADAKGTSGLLNDLWMFSPGTKLWTWEGGSNAANPTGVYGAQGVASVSNIPNPRAGAFAWTDPKGNFWLFSGATAMNDLWMFNPTTKQWTWMSGSATAGSAGSYGTLGVPAGSNLPPGRSYGSAWADSAGNLWLLGGIGLGSPNDGRIVSYDGSLNDQWMYSPATNQWTWVAGTNGLNGGGSYGTQGQPSSGNIPGNRHSQDFWTDTKGNFWLYGGEYLNLVQQSINYDKVQFYSDLWKFYAPSTTASGPLASLSAFGLQFNVVSGQTSSAQTITLSNPGTASLAISGITLAGTGASVYQQTNTCGAALAAGASCTISVTFAPLLPGSYPATLSVADSAAGSPQTIALTGFALTTTKTALSGVSSVITTDASDTLTVAVAGTSGTGTPTGTITLLAGGSTVTTLTLGSAGTATYAINQPPVGTTTYTAMYNGDTTYATSTSGSFTVTSIAGPTTSAPPWTWVNGASTPYGSGIATFATITDPAGQGVASASNYPGIRYDAPTWADHNGNLYFFGGINLNDLWTYNVGSGAWTFLKGSFSSLSGPVPSVYGSKGTPSPTSMPGPRNFAARWLDSAGNLWMFGGSGPDANSSFGPLDDLWMYVPSTNNWAWMGGDQTSAQSGVYGTLGVAASTNKPGGRNESMTWTDLSGNLWLFGGVGYDSTGNDTFLNDLWMYNTGTGQWTWQGGQSKSTLQVDTYTTQGAFAAGNTPSARVNGTTWVDTGGRLWLFGGSGYGATNSTGGDLNDLWVFDPSLKQWAFMGGTLTPYSAGTYGVLGKGSTNNVPAARESAAAFTDASGNFWLFGGAQITASSSGITDQPYNDLWMYNPTQTLWTWVAGSKTPSSSGTYGTLGAASTSNIPAARSSTLAWTDNAGNFWLLGGTNMDPYFSVFSAFDDLWKATPAAAVTPTVSVSPATLSFSNAAGTTSAPQTVAVTNTGAVAVTVSSISLTGVAASSFAQTNTCMTLLAANASCTVSITFSPTGPGNFPAALSIADNATGSPQTVVLTGTVGSCVNSPTTPYINCDPGGSVVTTSSATEQLTFAPPTVTTATANAYSTEIVGKYNGTVVYDQTFAAAYGTPTVQAGVTAANAAVAAAGGSSIPAPALTSTSTNTSSASTSTYSVAQPVASTTVYTVTTANTFGPAIIAAQIGGNGNPANPTAGYVSMCTEASLPSSTKPTCMATNAGQFVVLAGQLDINVNTDSNYLINTATTTTNTTTTNAVYAIAAALSAPVVTLNPTGPLSFTAASGSASATQTVTLTNSGTAALTGIAVGLSGGLGVFSESSNCPSSLAAGASCTIGIGFTPASVTTYTGAVSITDSASNAPQSIALNGTGTGVLAPATTIYPASLTFGSTLVNTTNSGQSITIANSGTAPLTVTGASIVGVNAANFAVSSNTCGTLGLGATCTIAVTFTPNSIATFNATLSIADNAGNSPQTVALSGTGSGPTELASIGPSFVDFANQAVNTTSGAVTVTLANIGNTALTSISPTITGAGASAFAISATTCIASVTVGKSCNFSITFTPSSTANFQAALMVADDASNSPHLVPLSGTGVAASTTSAATLSTTSLTFPNTAIGGSSPLTVMVTNSGTQALSIEGVVAGYQYSDVKSSISTPANAFTQTSTCGTTLAVGASCAITVTFTPAAAGPFSGTLLIADTSSSFAQAVTLTGVGIGGTGVSAALEPFLGLNFGTVALNTTSAPMTATLTNTGSVALTGITSGLSGTSGAVYTISATTCGASLAPGASCTLSITIRPTTAGQYGAVLNVADNAPDSPQQFQLGASTTCPTTPDTNCNPGGQTVLTSSNGVALAFTPAIVTTATATAVSTEIVGRYQGTVVYDQTFPAAYGTPAVQSGVTAANAAVLAAGGSGTVVPAPALTSSSTNTSTASTSVYSRDPAAPVSTYETTTTFGPGTVRVISPGVPPNPTTGLLTECTEASLPSSTMPTCYATDPGLFQILGGQTDINVNSTLTYLVDTATTTTTTTTTAAVYAINGTAATAPAVALTPAGPLSFSAVVGAKSPAQTVTILNSGTGALTLTGISLTGAGAASFAQTNTCGASLAGNASCTVSVTFSPGATGSFAAALSIADNATGSPQTVTLSGTGTAAPAPAVSLTPSTLSFTSTMGTASAVQMATLTNTGSATLNVTSIVISGAAFADTTTCGTTLSAGASCTIAVTFTPTAATGYTGALTVTDNATGSPHVVALSGTGTAVLTPVVSLTPTALSFTSVVGTASAAQFATLSNTGTGPLTISGIAIQGASGFVETTTCGGTLNAGASCSISVTFTPSGTSSVTAALAVTDNATGSPHTVALTGVGTVATAPVVSLAPTALSFSSVSGVASAVQSVTLQNTGNATLSIGSIAIGGTNASVFADTTGCGSTLAAGTSCSIAVTFTPTSVGSFAGTLTVTDNAGGSPQSVALSGAGTVAPSFTIGATPTSQTVQRGSAAVYMLTVTPQNGAFTGTVSLSASGLPSGASATLSPATLTPGSSAASSTLTIQTPMVALNSEPSLWRLGWGLGTPSLALIVFLLVPRRRFRRGTLCLLAFAALGASLELTGCGGAGFRLPSSSYNVTVTAASGTQQQTIIVQLTVQ